MIRDGGALIMGCCTADLQQRIHRSGETRSAWRFVSPPTISTTVDIVTEVRTGGVRSGDILVETGKGSDSPLCYRGASYCKVLSCTGAAHWRKRKRLHLKRGTSENVVCTEPLI